MSHLCVVFLAHMGVQQKEVWQAWKNTATRTVSFVVCHEEHRKASEDELIYKKYDPLFNDKFRLKNKFKREESRSMTTLMTKFKQLPLQEKQNALFYVMRLRRSLELGTYVIEDEQKTSNFGLQVPLSRLVPSEWSSPEIALNTAASLKFAVEKTNADIYWIVSGFDIPLVHPDNVTPFIQWKQGGYGPVMPSEYMMTSRFKERITYFCKVSG